MTVARFGRSRHSRSIYSSIFGVQPKSFDSVNIQAAGVSVVGDGSLCSTHKFGLDYRPPTTMGLEGKPGSQSGDFHLIA